MGSKRQPSPKLRQKRPKRKKTGAEAPPALTPAQWSEFGEGAKIKGQSTNTQSAARRNRRAAQRGPPRAFSCLADMGRQSTNRALKKLRTGTISPNLGLKARIPAGTKFTDLNETQQGRAEEIIAQEGRKSLYIRQSESLKRWNNIHLINQRKLLGLGKDDSIPAFKLKRIERQEVTDSEDEDEDEVEDEGEEEEDEYEDIDEDPDKQKNPTSAKAPKTSKQPSIKQKTQLPKPVPTKLPKDVLAYYAKIGSQEKVVSNAYLHLHIYVSRRAYILSRRRYQTM